MTYVLPACTTQGLEGVDVTQTYLPSSSTSTTPEYPAPPFAAGTRANFINGAEYLFILANAAVTQYQVIAVKESDGSGDPATKAMVDAGREIAVAQVAIASGSYGWVQTRGAGYVKMKTAALPSVPLYTSATTGALDDTSASQTRIYGIRLQATSTASNSATSVWISNMTV